MPLPTLNSTGIDKPFRPWDPSRPPGSGGQGVRAESQSESPRTSASQSEFKDRRRDSLPDFEQGWDHRPEYAD